jgi:hypothetical protein
MYNYTWCIPLAFISPCRLPFVSPSGPFLLTWNPPSCDRIRPPRSQVACKLTSPVPTLYPNPPPLQTPRTPTAQRLTTTTSGTVRRLLSGTIALKHVFCCLIQTCYTGHNLGYARGGFLNLLEGNVRIPIFKRLALW